MEIEIPLGKVLCHSCGTISEPGSPVHLQNCDKLVTSMDVLDTPMHDWFGLSYASYLVMPRIALESMPVSWQRRMVGLMDEMNQHFGGDARFPLRGNYEVRVRDDAGRFIDDPFRDYRHAPLVTRADFEEKA